MLDVCCDPTLYNEYIAMVETGRECQFTDYMSSRGKTCYGGLLRGSVVPAKFLLVLLSTLPVEDETSNALVVVWFGNGVRCISRKRDTAQTERILMRLVSTSSLDSRLHQSRKRVFPRHPCFEPVLSCCLCQCCTQNSLFLLSPYFAHGSGASGFFSVDPRQYNMSTTEELLARLVNLKNEAVQVRQRQGSAEQALAAAQQRIQQLSSGGSAPTVTIGVIDTRTLGKPKTFTGQPSEWTTWQFTFKAFACATHSRMRDVFELATRKGSDPVVNSDMTAELQSLSTQLYHMLLMMLSDQALEIVRNTPEGVGAEVWRKLLWEYEPGVGIRYGAMLQSLLKRRFGEHDETDLAREIESFERDISKYEQQSRYLISDAMKHGIVCGGMAHPGLKQHIDPSINNCQHTSHFVTRSSITPERVERGQIQKFDGECRYCQQRGHKKADCRKVKSDIAASKCDKSGKQIGVNALSAAGATQPSPQASCAPSMASTIPLQQMVPVYFPCPDGSQTSQPTKTWFIMIVAAQKTLMVASLDGA